MQTLWILWWLGPDTTAKFYLEIIHRLAREKTLNHPPILIWNTALPKELEERFLITWKGIKEYLTYLIEWAKSLENGGAHYIVIPCNSVHVLIEEIRKSVKIPVISIVEETFKYIQEHHIEDIGIISTSATSENKLYESLFDLYNIDYKVVTRSEQIALNQVICNIVQWQSTPQDQTTVYNILSTMQQRWAKNMLLACTDLQIVCSNFYEFPLLDTMNILAKSSVSLLMNSN